jgi:hypothetical protein
MFYPSEKENNREEKILGNICLLLLSYRTYNKIAALLYHNQIPLNDSEIFLIEKHLSALPELMTLYFTLPRDKYRFSETLEAFFSSFTYHQPVIHYLIENPKSLYEPNIAKALFAFLNTFKKHISSLPYKTKIKSLEIEDQNNFVECTRYINDLFSILSKLVVIRLDLGYESHLNVDIEDFQRDFKKFYTNARHNRIFDHLGGYVLKIEYGIKKKLHLHLILFFNGHKRKGSSDVYLAKRIGEYWVNVITQGQGWYWNCNDEKEKKYRWVGIGLIEAKDMDKRKNLLRAVGYLCKKKIQVIKPLSNPKMKSIRKGLIPKKKLNLGKRREESDSDFAEISDDLEIEAIKN